MILKEIKYFGCKGKIEFVTDTLTKNSQNHFAYSFV